MEQNNDLKERREEDLTLDYDDLGILERKSAMNVLLMISKNPGSTKQKLMRMAGCEKTTYNLLRDFEEVGLIVSTLALERRYRGHYVWLTPEGERIVENIQNIKTILLRMRGVYE